MVKPEDIFPIQLPVKFHRESVFGNDRCGDFGYITDARRNFVTRHRLTELLPGVTEANIARAEFIACTINSHAVMLAALKRMLIEVPMGSGQIKQVANAIAVAEGKAEPLP